MIESLTGGYSDVTMLRRAPKIIWIGLNSNTNKHPISKN